MKNMLKFNHLMVNIYDSRIDMGEGAVQDICANILQVLSLKSECNIIFAAAPSQNEVLSGLVARTDIDFSRINAFHMDEYIGLPCDAPQGFANFLKRTLFHLVTFKNVFCLDGNNVDIETECARYSGLLSQYPTDIVCMGIGENGHIAFNDPPVADFQDSKMVKPVELDQICRNQQVNDGCFSHIDLVPTHALTLTIPALVNVPAIFCVVPSISKAQAVKDTLLGEISTSCPASILRDHPNATLYLDRASTSLL